MSKSTLPMVRARSFLDAVMIEQGIKNTEVAEAIGVTSPTVSSWRGGLRPPKERRQAIAEYLALKEDDLWP